MADTDFAEIERLSEKVRRDPKSRIFAQLADAYRKAGMCDEAFEVLKTGLEIHPNYANAHLVLARCYVDKHMHEMAKDSLKQLIQLDPQSLVGFKLLAQTCERLGDEDGLITAYKGITAMDPSDTQVRAKLEALLKKKSSEDVVGSLSLAKEYEGQGYFDKALDIYKRLSYQDPGDIVITNKIKELSQKVAKPETNAEAVKTEGLETISAFAPPVEAKPEPKLEKLPPLEEILPPEAPKAPDLGQSFLDQLGAAEAKPSAVEKPKVVPEVKPKPVEPKPPEPKPVEPPPADDLRLVAEQLGKIADEPAAIPPLEITPLEALLEPAAPAPATPAEPKPLAEDEIKSLDQFLAPPEEKPIEEKVVEKKIFEEKPPEVKAEEPLPSLDSLLKKEEPPSQPKPAPAPTPEPKPQPAPKPKDDEAADRPKGDDFQSFQDWLSGLLK